jgi:hypothetical protein
MHLIADSATRVAAATDPLVNQRLRTQTAERLAAIGEDIPAIQRRLRELDAEWDIERVLEAHAAALALGGSVLGLLVDRRFLAIPIAVLAFLLLHAAQGWCPPVSLLRRWGFRTPREIEDERHALRDRLQRQLIK